MNKYEINFVLDKKLTPYGRLNISKKFIQSILEIGGSVIDLQYLGVHSFYSTKKSILINQKGKFSIINCYLNPKGIKTINILLNQNEYILNYMIIKK